jgi:hypothetical protein
MAKPAQPAQPQPLALVPARDFSKPKENEKKISAARRIAEPLAY